MALDWLQRAFLAVVILMAVLMAFRHVDPWGHYHGQKAVDGRSSASHLGGLEQ